MDGRQVTHTKASINHHQRRHRKFVPNKPNKLLQFLEQLPQAKQGGGGALQADGQIMIFADELEIRKGLRQLSLNAALYEYKSEEDKKREACEAVHTDLK